MTLSLLTTLIPIIFKILTFTMQKMGAKREDWLYLVELAKWFEARGVLRAKHMVQIERAQNAALDAKMEQLEKENAQKNP